jgi:two-component system phosphate regulon sensor histidine kinase PhoR
MTRHLIELLLAVALGALGGMLKQEPTAVLIGALAGALAWGVLDAMRAERLLIWLNKADTSSLPSLSGRWGELLDRNQKLLKRLEKEVQKGDARLANFLATIQASPNGVVLLDAAGRIEWVNLTAANQLGIDPLKDLGQYVQNLVRAPAFTAYFSGADFGSEIQINGVGLRLSLPSRISVQIHPYGERRRLMLTRDVTAVELAETMRRDFVANVSHEIRTPLTVLSGFVETLQSIPVSQDEQERYLSLMSQQAQRMQTLVSDLLTLSRLEGSPTPGQGQWIESEELLKEAMQEAQALSRVIAQPAHVIEHAQSASFGLAGVRSELLSAMSNLLSNAVRYTPDGGLIRTGWHVRADGWAEFVVDDSGPGIAAEHLPRLTERFYRVDRSRSRETGGTGLGLAIVKHVVQRHGGQLDIQSTLGKGSTFRISLPPVRVKLPESLTSST